jgi:hypothetical protein
VAVGTLAIDLGESGHRQSQKHGGCEHDEQFVFHCVTSHKMFTAFFASTMETLSR